MKAAYLIAILVVVLSVLLFSSAFIVDEREQVFVTQFGQPVGDPITEAGIHFKRPFIQKLHSFDKRILEWDGNPNEVPTRDKKFIRIDTYARWRIADPLQFFQSVKDTYGAQTRLDDILDGATRSVIAKNDLVDVVRSVQREPQVADSNALTEEMDTLPAFKTGRGQIVQEMLESSKPALSELGIELVDIRFKRINYSPEVQREIYNRMIAERQRIADKFVSEGEGEKAKIQGQRERELKTIQSEAYRKSQEITGKADAEAVKIYAQAFNQSPEAREFYQFLKTLETYKNSLTSGDRLILSTKTDFYKYLKNATPKPESPSNVSD